MIEKVKKAARITNSALDDEIERLIEWSKAELVRAGVPEIIVENEGNALVTQAIISGSLTQLANDPDSRAEAKEAWEYQKDILRKHKWGD